MEAGRVYVVLRQLKGVCVIVAVNLVLFPGREHSSGLRDEWN